MSLREKRTRGGGGSPARACGLALALLLLAVRVELSVGLRSALEEASSAVLSWELFGKKKRKQEPHFTHLYVDYSLSKRVGTVLNTSQVQVPSAAEVGRWFEKLAAIRSAQGGQSLPHQFDAPAAVASRLKDLVSKSLTEVDRSGVHVICTQKDLRQDREIRVTLEPVTAASSTTKDLMCHQGEGGNGECQSYEALFAPEDGDHFVCAVANELWEPYDCETAVSLVEGELVTAVTGAACDGLPSLKVEAIPVMDTSAAGSTDAAEAPDSGDAAQGSDSANAKPKSYQLTLTVMAYSDAKTTDGGGVGSVDEQQDDLDSPVEEAKGPLWDGTFSSGEEEVSYATEFALRFAMLARGRNHWRKGLLATVYTSPDTMKEEIIEIELDTGMAHCLLYLYSLPEGGVGVVMTFKEAGQGRLIPVSKLTFSTKIDETMEAPVDVQKEYRKPVRSLFALMKTLRVDAIRYILSRWSDGKALARGTSLHQWLHDRDNWRWAAFAGHAGGAGMATIAAVNLATALGIKESDKRVLLATVDCPYVSQQKEAFAAYANTVVSPHGGLMVENPPNRVTDASSRGGSKRPGMHVTLMSPALSVSDVDSIYMVPSMVGEDFELLALSMQVGKRLRTRDVWDADRSRYQLEMCDAMCWETTVPITWRASEEAEVEESASTV